MTLKLIASAVIAALLLTGNALPPTQLPEGNSAPAPAEATAVITAREAEAAALDHAGFTATEVTNLRSRYDADERIAEYDVEFRVGDWEYDYSIHAETGAVLEWDKDYEPRKAAPPVTEPPVTEPPATQPPAEPGRLTREEALKIALEKAGLTQDQVKRVKAELDWDDGIPEYEVEFTCNGWEYEFDIHAETGRILSWDKEYDD